MNTESITTIETNSMNVDMTKMKTKLVPSDVIANVVKNYGRMSEVYDFNQELFISMLTSNTSIITPIVVFPIGKKRAKACCEKTNTMLRSLLSKFEEKARVIKYDVAGETENPETGEITKTEITKEVSLVPKQLEMGHEDKVEYAVYAGNMRVSMAHIVRLLTGRNMTFSCIVAKDEAEAIKLARMENVSRETGVTELTNKDYYLLILDLIKDGLVHRECDLTPYGVKRARAQKLYGLCQKAHTVDGVHEQIMGDKIPSGDGFITINQLPAAFGSYLRKQDNTLEAFYEACTLKCKPRKAGDVGAGKSMSGPDIKELLGSCRSEVAALLSGLLANDAGAVSQARAHIEKMIALAKTTEEYLESIEELDSVSVD